MSPNHDLTSPNYPGPQRKDSHQVRSCFDFCVFLEIIIVFSNTVITAKRPIESS